MIMSYAQSASLQCSNCNHTADYELWLIVNPEEYPELLASIEDGSLHTVSCQKCGHPVQADKPLIIFNPSALLPVIFSPAQKTSIKKDNEAFEHLLDHVRKHYGGQWLEAWHDFFYGPARRIHIPEHLERQKGTSVEDWPILDTFYEFHYTSGLPAARDWLLANPILLTDKVVRIIDELIYAARLNRRTDTITELEQDRDLIQRCLTHGVDATFSELMSQVPTELVELAMQGQIAFKRYRENKDQDLLEEALALYVTLVQHPTFPEASQDFQAGTLWDLARLYHNQFGAKRSLEDLRNAINTLAAAVQLVPASDKLDCAGALNRLGIWLQEYYNQTSGPDTLAKAVAAWEEALELAKELEGESVQWRIPVNLANGIRERFKLEGDIQDLHRAIELYEAVMSRKIEDSDEAATVFNSYANGLHDRYKRLGRSGDLDVALGAWSLAVNLSEDLEQKISFIGNLANGYRALYNRDADIDALNQAISLNETTTSVLSEDSVLLPNRLMSLGIALQDRYQLGRNKEDLDRAIAAIEKSIELEPETSTRQPSFQYNLLNALESRYLYQQDLKDLKRMRAVADQLVHITPPTSTARPSYLAARGRVKRNAYYRYKDTGYLDDSIVDFRQACRLTSANSADRPYFIHQLAIGLHERFRKTARTEDLEEATTRYKEACQASSKLAFNTTIRSALDWGNWAFERRAWDEAVDAYDYGLAAVEQMLDRQTTRRHKEVLLRRIQGLASRAAYARAMNGDPTGAVETLEQGRARLLGEALEINRTDLVRLAYDKHKALYQRYRQAVERVADLDRADTVPQAQPTTVDELRKLRINQEKRSAQLNEASRELKEAMADIQSLEDYQDFFKPMDKEAILAAVRSQPRAGDDDLPPVIYLLTTPHGGLALVVDAAESDDTQRGMPGNGAIRLIEFPLNDGQLNDLLARRKRWEEMTLNEQMRANEQRLRTYTFLSVGSLLGYDPNDLSAYARLSDYDAPSDLFTDLDQALDGYLMGQFGLRPMDQTLDAVLPKLGQQVMAPIAEALRRAEEDSMPRSVTLIPEGRLALLPLHAASYEVDGQRHYFADEFIVSYLPSARSLEAIRLALTRREEKEHHHLAGVGNPLPHPEPLPYAAAELLIVAGHFPEGKNHALFGEEASKEALLEKLPGADYVHLACHGYFDIARPLDSHLLMAKEEQLTLREIMAENQVAHTRLVTLSACETAIPDVRVLPDEALNLSVAFLQAGVPGIVSTLWAVKDLFTMLLMERFYTHHLGGMPPAMALRQAQIDIRQETAGQLARRFEAEMDKPDEERLMSYNQASEAWQHFSFKFDEQDSPYDDPCYWAAFTFTGI